MEERWTPSGVRLRLAAASPGPWNWLLVPGGPGLGSESLAGLAQVCTVPGRVWLVDLPGDGSNRGHAAVPARPFQRWPHVLAEALDQLEDCVVVGHSTGGMFALSVPALERRLSALVLVSSGPDAGWRQAFERWAAAHPVPGLEDAAQRYAASPGDGTLRDLTVAAAPWNFTAAGLTRGRALLAGLTYCHEAVTWADAHFDATYRAAWRPRGLPTLIVSGAEDHVVDQRVWERADGFTGPEVLRHVIDGAGHFPWIENPRAVRAAFAALLSRLSPAAEG
ncbi:alpha/beta fold hydrolase [Streptacidiphilus melanogenes]|uniref:alpha/beta fold hydrolase n=1 Tax=Streptacidiphilus melanogenes TaxID=411235 RepID=UPI0005A87AC3|nr:alpha/beta fold hydrolase [Streptacidiphilus melanogenes]